MRLHIRSIRNPHHRFRSLIGTALIAVVSAASQPAAAINIEIELENHGHNPATDPTGTMLRDMFNVAAIYWERLIPGGTTHTVDVWWEPIANSSLGLWTQTANPFGDNDIRINPNLNWFIDPTPYEHEEYDFSTTTPPGPSFQGQSFYRNLTTTEQNDWFNEDAPPGLLEVGYRGKAMLSSPAFGQYDLLSTIMHELGHELGIHEGVFSDFDFSLLGVPGNVDAATDGGHLAARYSLMCESCGATSLRRLPSAVDVLAAGYQELTRMIAQGLAGGPNVDLARKHFFSGSNWNAPTGWIGFAVPDALDEASVLGAQFATLTAPGFADTLNVGEASLVTTSNRKLDVTTLTRIAGIGSSLHVETGGELESTTVSLESSGTLALFNGGLLDTINLNVGPGSTLYGLTGTHTVHTQTSLVNDGSIIATGNSTMNFTTASVYPWDLDGTTETGIVDASFGNINFVSGGLADVFSGTMKVGAGHFIAINLPWALVGSGKLDLNGGGNSANRARFAGAAITEASVAANINASGLAHLDAPFIMLAGMVNVAASATLEFNNTADIEAGAFDVAENGNLNFNAATTLSGYVYFRTFSTSASKGDVEFNGPTTYAGGTINITGVARQDGNPTVTNPTTINANVFDMDGSNTTATTWTLNKPLTINADYVETISLAPAINPNNIVNSNISITHSGSITVLDPDSGQLNVNLSANRSWRLAGTVNLDGSISGPLRYVPDMITGSLVLLTGTLNVQDRVGIAAPFNIFGPVNINTGSSLTLRNNSLVGTAAVFSGSGGLFNSTGQTLTLVSGAVVNVATTNSGNLEIGSSPGIATVKSYTQGDTGSLHVEIAGQIPGLEYDRMIVAGAMALAGTLNVSLINGFSPAANHAFDVLDFASLSGTFSQLSLPGLAGGLAWDISQLYTSGILRVAVGIPGDYNQNGTVDAGDYTVWRDALGQTGGGLAADGNNSGTIDAGDYNIWKLNFGQTAGSGAVSNAAVPEPASLVLLLLACVCCCLERIGSPHRVSQLANS